ncbi:methionine ABC transporter permease [Bacillus glycinifermentans]|uniref:ABC transporter permease n=1 Tax=Bacillus glycinifermentans TaxID=1664069 RepID=A0A0J6HC60_9BACI|nr:methionine ABC transporter permease [Bacillus glycinifermentans]ATH93057.1 ABC transporter permease [Bacillus glycinifermentans]KMM56787.1 methionine ABC transporter permease [Bacillus glycinifermentans]KRT94300.1 methionine ABC transporter permease [Bacillus glycinifermentans]MEC0485827.1 ABC transporter permease [Bacillus glycinifermentans]MEC0495653.1 ABC transporter permease [Bacillus glycinifermentans]
MFEKLFPNVNLDNLWNATYETVYMTGISLLFAFIIGIILGLLLYLTSKGNIWENKVINAVISAIVNVFRSIPFIILIIILLSFTKFIMGTILGPNAALPALIIASAPFYARLVEIALREVDKGVIEAAKSMGAKTSTIIFKVLLPESMPALISGITVTAIALIGSTAMAGAIGSGGLGNLAYVDGFQMNCNDIIVIATIFILAIVFIIQLIGDFITNKLDKR